MSNWTPIGYCSRCLRPIFSSFEHLCSHEWSVGVSCHCQKGKFKSGNPALEHKYLLSRCFGIAFFSGLYFLTDNFQFLMCSVLISLVGWAIYAFYKTETNDRRIQTIYSFDVQGEITQIDETVYSNQFEIRDTFLLATDNYFAQY